MSVDKLDKNNPQSNKMSVDPLLRRDGQKDGDATLSRKDMVPTREAVDGSEPKNVASKMVSRKDVLREVVGFDELPQEYKQIILNKRAAEEKAKLDEWLNRVIIRGDDGSATARLLNQPILLGDGSGSNDKSIKFGSWEEAVAYQMPYYQQHVADMATKSASVLANLPDKSINWKTQGHTATPSQYIEAAYGIKEDELKLLPEFLRNDYLNNAKKYKADATMAMEQRRNKFEGLLQNKSEVLSQYEKARLAGIQSFYNLINKRGETRLGNEVNESFVGEFGELALEFPDLYQAQVDKYLKEDADYERDTLSKELSPDTKVAIEKNKVAVEQARRDRLLSVFVPRYIDEGPQKGMWGVRSFTGGFGLRGDGGGTVYFNTKEDAVNYVIKERDLKSLFPSHGGSNPYNPPVQKWERSSPILDRYGISEAQVSVLPKEIQDIYWKYKNIDEVRHAEDLEKALRIIGASISAGGGGFGGKQTGVFGTPTNITAAIAANVQGQGGGGYSTAMGGGGYMVPGSGPGSVGGFIPTASVSAAAQAEAQAVAQAKAGNIIINAKGEVVDSSLGLTTVDGKVVSKTTDQLKSEGYMRAIGDGKGGVAQRNVFTTNSDGSIGSIGDTIVGAGGRIVGGVGMGGIIGYTKEPSKSPESPKIEIGAKFDAKAAKDKAEQSAKNNKEENKRNEGNKNYTPLPETADKVLESQGYTLDKAGKIKNTEGNIEVWRSLSAWENRGIGVSSSISGDVNKALGDTSPEAVDTFLNQKVQAEPLKNKDGTPAIDPLTGEQRTQLQVGTYDVESGKFTSISGKQVVTYNADGSVASVGDVMIGMNTGQILSTDANQYASQFGRVDATKLVAVTPSVESKHISPVIIIPIDVLANLYLTGTDIKHNPNPQDNIIIEGAQKAAVLGVDITSPEYVSPYTGVITTKGSALFGIPMGTKVLHGVRQDTSVGIQRMSLPAMQSIQIVETAKAFIKDAKSKNEVLPALLNAKDEVIQRLTTEGKTDYGKASNLINILNSVGDVKIGQKIGEVVVTKDNLQSYINDTISLVKTALDSYAPSTNWEALSTPIIAGVEAKAKELSSGLGRDIPTGDMLSDYYTKVVSLKNEFITDTKKDYEGFYKAVSKIVEDNRTGAKPMAGAPASIRGDVGTIEYSIADMTPAASIAVGATITPSTSNVVSIVKRGDGSYLATVKELGVNRVFVIKADGTWAKYNTLADEASGSAYGVCTNADCELKDYKVATSIIADIKKAGVVLAPVVTPTVEGKTVPSLYPIPSAIRKVEMAVRGAMDRINLGTVEASKWDKVMADVAQRRTDTAGNTDWVNVENELNYYIMKQDVNGEKVEGMPLEYYVGFYNKPESLPLDKSLLQQLADNLPISTEAKVFINRFNSNSYAPEPKIYTEAEKQKILSRSPQNGRELLQWIYSRYDVPINLQKKIYDNNVSIYLDEKGMEGLAYTPEQRYINDVLSTLIIGAPRYKVGAIQIGLKGEFPTRENEYEVVSYPLIDTILHEEAHFEFLNLGKEQKKEFADRVKAIGVYDLIKNNVEGVYKLKYGIEQNVTQEMVIDEIYASLLPMVIKNDTTVSNIYLGALKNSQVKELLNVAQPYMPVYDISNSDIEATKEIIQGALDRQKYGTAGDLNDFDKTFTYILPQYTNKDGSIRYGELAFVLKGLINDVATGKTVLNGTPSELKLSTEMRTLKPRVGGMEKSPISWDVLEPIGTAQEIDITIPDRPDLTGGGIAATSILTETLKQKPVPGSYKVGPSNKADGPPELTDQIVATFTGKGTVKGRGLAPDTDMTVYYAVVKNPDGSVGGLWYKDAGGKWQEGDYKYHPRTGEIEKIVCVGAACDLRAADLQEGIKYVVDNKWMMPAAPSATEAKTDGALITTKDGMRVLQPREFKPMTEEEKWADFKPLASTEDGQLLRSLGFKQFEIQSGLQKGYSISQLKQIATLAGKEKTRPTILREGLLKWGEETLKVKPTGQVPQSVTINTQYLAQDVVTPLVADTTGKAEPKRLSKSATLLGPSLELTSPGGTKFVFDDKGELVSATKDEYTGKSELNYGWERVDVTPLMKARLQLEKYGNEPPVPMDYTGKKENYDITTADGIWRTFYQDYNVPIDLQQKIRDAGIRLNISELGEGVGAQYEETINIPKDENILGKIIREILSGKDNNDYVINMAMPSEDGAIMIGGGVMTVGHELGHFFYNRNTDDQRKQLIAASKSIPNYNDIKDAVFSGLNIDPTNIPKSWSQAEIDDRVADEVYASLFNNLFDSRRRDYRVNLKLIPDDVKDTFFKAFSIKDDRITSLGLSYGDLVSGEGLSMDALLETGRTEKAIDRLIDDSLTRSGTNKETTFDKQILQWIRGDAKKGEMVNLPTYAEVRGKLVQLAKEIADGTTEIEGAPVDVMKAIAVLAREMPDLGAPEAKPMRGEPKSIAPTGKTEIIHLPIVTSGLSSDIFTPKPTQEIIEPKTIQLASEVKGVDLPRKDGIYYKGGSGGVVVEYFIERGAGDIPLSIWYRDPKGIWTSENFSRVGGDVKIECTQGLCNYHAADLAAGVRYIIEKGWKSYEAPSGGAWSLSKVVVPPIQKLPPPIDIKPTDKYIIPDSTDQFKLWRDNFNKAVQQGQIIAEGIFAGINGNGEPVTLTQDSYNALNSTEKDAFQQKGIAGIETWKGQNVATNNAALTQLVNYKTQEGNYKIFQFAQDRRNAGESWWAIAQVLVNAGFDEYKHGTVAGVMSQIPPDRYASDAALMKMTIRERAEYLSTHADDVRFAATGLLITAAPITSKVVDMRTALDMAQTTPRTYANAIALANINSNPNMTYFQKQEAIAQLLGEESAQGIEDIRNSFKPLWDVSENPQIATVVSALATPNFAIAMESGNPLAIGSEVVNALIISQNPKAYEQGLRNKIQLYDKGRQLVAEAWTPKQTGKILTDWYNAERGALTPIVGEGAAKTIADIGNVPRTFNAYATQAIWEMAKTVGGVIPLTILKMPTQMKLGEANEIAASTVELAGGMVMMPVAEFGGAMGGLSRGEFAKTGGRLTGLGLTMVVSPAHLAKSGVKGTIFLGDMTIRDGKVFLKEAFTKGGGGLAALDVPKAYYKLIDELNGIFADKETVAKYLAIKDPVQSELHLKSLLSAESRPIWEATKQMVEFAHEHGDLPKSWYAKEVNFAQIRDFPKVANEAVRQVFKDNKNNGYFKGSLADVSQIQDSTLRALIGEQYGRIGDGDYVVTNSGAKAVDIANQVVDAMNNAAGSKIAVVSGTTNNAKVRLINGEKDLFQIHTEGAFGKKPFGWEDKFTFTEVDGIKMTNFKDQLFRRGDIVLYPATDEMAGTFGLFSETATKGTETLAVARRSVKDWFRLEYQVKLIIENLKDNGKVELANKLQEYLNTARDGVKAPFAEGGTVAPIAVGEKTTGTVLSEQAKKDMFEIFGILQEVAINEGKTAYFVTPEGTIFRTVSPSEQLLQNNLIHVTRDIRPYLEYEKQGKTLKAGFVLDEKGNYIPIPEKQIFFSPQAALDYLNSLDTPHGGLVMLRATEADRAKYLSVVDRIESYPEAKIASFDVFGKKINIGKVEVVGKIFDEMVLGKKPIYKTVKGEVTSIKEPVKIANVSINKGNADISVNINYNPATKGIKLKNNDLHITLFSEAEKTPQLIKALEDNANSMPKVEIDNHLYGAVLGDRDTQIIKVKNQSELNTWLNKVRKDAGLPESDRLLHITISSSEDLGRRSGIADLSKAKITDLGSIAEKTITSAEKKVLIGFVGEMGAPKYTEFIFTDKLGGQRLVDEIAKEYNLPSTEAKFSIEDEMFAKKGTHDRDWPDSWITLSSRLKADEFYHVAVHELIHNSDTIELTSPEMKDVSRIMDEQSKRSRSPWDENYIMEEAVMETVTELYTKKLLGLSDDVTYSLRELVDFANEHYGNGVGNRLESIINNWVDKLPVSKKSAHSINELKEKLSNKGININDVIKTIKMEEGTAYPLGQKYTVRGMDGIEQYPIVWFAMEDALSKGLGIPDMATVKAINSLAWKQAIKDYLHPKLNKNVQVIFDPLATGKGGGPINWGDGSWGWKKDTPESIQLLIEKEANRFSLPDGMSKLNDELKVLVDRGDEAGQAFNKIVQDKANGIKQFIIDSVKASDEITLKIAQDTLDRINIAIDTIPDANVKQKFIDIRDSLKANIDAVDVQAIPNVLKEARRQLDTLKVKETILLGINKTIESMIVKLDEHIIKLDDIRISKEIKPFRDPSEYYKAVGASDRAHTLWEIRSRLTEESRAVWDATFQLGEELYRSTQGMKLRDAPEINFQTAFGSNRMSAEVANRVKAVVQGFAKDGYLCGSFGDFFQMYGIDLPDMMKPKDADIHLFANSKVTAEQYCDKLLEALMEDGDIIEADISPKGFKRKTVYNPNKVDAEGNMEVKYVQLSDAEGDAMRSSEILDYRFAGEGDETLFDVSPTGMFDNDLTLKEWEAKKNYFEIDGIMINDIRNQFLDRLTVLLMPAVEYVGGKAKAMQRVGMSGTFGTRAETATTGLKTGVKPGRDIKDWNRTEYLSNYFIDRLKQEGKLDLAEALEFRLGIAKEGIKTLARREGLMGKVLDEIEYAVGLSQKKGKIGAADTSLGFVTGTPEMWEAAGIISKKAGKKVVDAAKLKKMVREGSSTIAEDYLVNLGDLSRVYYSQLPATRNLPYYSSVPFTVIPSEAATVEGIISTVSPTIASRDTVGVATLPTYPVIRTTTPTLSTIPTTYITTPTTPPTTPTTPPTTPTTPHTKPTTPPTKTTTPPTYPTIPTTPPTPPKPPNPPRRTPPTQPPFERKRKWEELTREEKLASIVWKQGWAYWALAAPFTQKDLIYSNKPFAGTKIHSGPKSAYKSVAKVKGAQLPDRIDIDLGIMDLTFMRDKDGKDVKVFYRADPLQKTTGKGPSNMPETLIHRTGHVQVSSVG